MDSTAEINAKYATNCKYWCVFLFRYSENCNKSGEFIRWYPDLYRYTRCTKSNSIIHRDRVLVRLTNTPCSIKFIQWATLLPLYNTNTVSLIGPFNFAPVNEFNCVRQTVDRTKWDDLVCACKLSGLLPPPLSSINNHRQLQANYMSVYWT